MKKTLSLPLLVLLPLALAACGKPAAPAPDASPAAQTPAADAAAPAAATADTESLLGGHHWQLVEASDAAGARIEDLFVRPDAPLQLDFAEGRLGVGNACNRHSGDYVLEEGRMRVGRLASTMRACADPKLGALDAAIGKRLEGTLGLATASGDAPRLTLTTADGDRLVFAGHPTAATRYGTVPERVFLDVAADTRPCSHPLIPDKQCLQVREVRYDDNGVRVGEPGAWENFYEDIEGYVHEPGVRNVLRIDRYTRTQVPADASRYAYVLDMVVESEVMRDLE